MIDKHRLYVASLLPLATVSAGCDLLPQDSTEWTIAIVATVVLIVGSITAAVIAEKKSKK